MNVLPEKEFQQYFVERLVKDNGYIERSANKFNEVYALDQELLFKFLWTTQKETMEQLQKSFGNDLETTIINCISNQITSKNGSLIDALKQGVLVDRKPLKLMYSKPETNFNRELVQMYENNIFSVMQEVWASGTERVDLVIFLNGLAIMTFELKSDFSGQTYKDAVDQYAKDRDPKDRLFMFKVGAIVNFAMDTNEVYMTTKLEKENTSFRPFNMGKGTGADTGKGNPTFEDKYSVSYMWDNILTKSSILELLNDFIYVETIEKVDIDTGKIITKENLIFPRFHQIDVIRKTLQDVYTNSSSKKNNNYLIQHSAGSGKTLSIAWLAYRLATLHNKDNNIIYDKVIVVTDRIIVDRQLQSQILKLKHNSGFIQAMDENCTSTDLANALNNNVKIVITTIQKFPYIINDVSNLKEKSFAVIIDEAHSSTTGKDMIAVNKTLGSDDGTIEEKTSEDLIVDEIKKHGKQTNVSMFAFTATPKPTTLQLFGKQNSKGQFEAFHNYSMKQAIEEGYILDVLQNYIEYSTFYKLNKEIEEDPKCKTNDAKRQIARFIELHDTNIAQRVEIIIEHFRTSVMSQLDGKAKAMVITKSREAAVKYRQAFEKYTKEKNYTNIHALVAFSGKVKLKDDDNEYSEALMNGFPENRLASEFDSDNYQVLLVANKYQTGFDQPKLCAMYVMKKLKGVNAVQTLSRLNRTCLPYEKKVVVLDFVNSYEDIQEAFRPYYTTTILSNTINPNSIYELEAKIDAYTIIDPNDIDKLMEIIDKPKITSKDKIRVKFYMDRSINIINKYKTEDQLKILQLMRNFVRYYEFLIQVSCFEDIDLHKKYRYISIFLSYFSVDVGRSYNLEGKIKATNFYQKKDQEFTNEPLTADPIVKLPDADKFGIKDIEKKRLSEIIEDINRKMGASFDDDVVYKAALQIKDLLMKSDKLKKSALNNSLQDFDFAYQDDIDDALIKGLGQNKDFFTLLLNNKEYKKAVLGIFKEEIYNELRNKSKQ